MFAPEDVVLTLPTLIPPISPVAAVFKLIVPESVIAVSEEAPVRPVPGVIDVTVPLYCYSGKFSCVTVTVWPLTVTPLTYFPVVAAFPPLNVGI